jgi:hypothetical protein
VLIQNAYSLQLPAEECDCTVHKLYPGRPQHSDKIAEEPCMGCADRCQLVSILPFFLKFTQHTFTILHLSKLARNDRPTDRPTDCWTRGIMVAIAELKELGRAGGQYGRRMASGSTTSEGRFLPEVMAGRHTLSWILPHQGPTTKHITSLLLPSVDHSTTYDSYPALDKVYVIAIAHYVRLFARQSQTACWS